MIEDLYDKTLKCPICKKSFTTKKVKSKSIKVLNRDSEFRADYEGENPTYYGVDVCPHCGHARFESDFNDVNPAAKKIIEDEIASKWHFKDFGQERSVNDAAEAHKLALLNYNLTNYKLTTIAKVCLRLSWFYKGLEGGLDERFASHALAAYEKAYVTENLDDNPKEELTILYLLGELNRRFKNYKKSMDWFGLALKSPVINEDKFLSESIKDQMRLTKDLYKKEKEAKEDIKS